MRFLALSLILLLSLNSCLTAADSPSPLVLHAPKPIQVDEDRIRQHIAFLAGDKLAGRSGAGSRLAAEYLKKEFQSLKLEPLFEGDFFQPVPGSKKFGIAGGRNVGALLPGSDPKLREDYIIIAAHYDHLGTRGGAIFPGADDNASGTAMMLEAARVLSQSTQKLKRSVMFVGFDLEERLLWGSRWFVAHPPVPQEQMKCLLVADMIGRSLAGLDLNTVFVMGSEHSPQLTAALDDARTPETLHLARLGIDLIGIRSDYGPFWNVEIPFLFFSSGEHPDYHKPTDTAEKIRYQQVVMVTDLVQQLTAKLADDKNVPSWTNEITPSIEEVRAVRTIATRLLENQPKHKPLGTSQLLLLGHIKAETSKILSRGEMSSGERTWLVRVSQLLLFSVL
ncbi:MAG: M28 family peptidase [Planctomycetaceae bacterium]|jgi:hypothetical protein|nr:M28 family peptidase [Planctomycetaceae bacterium]